MNDAASRYDELTKTLHAFAAPATHEPMSFGSAVDQLDRSAYTLTATLMVLPFLQPISLGLFALVGSAAFIALGVQLFKGQTPLKLPVKIRAVTLNIKVRRTRCHSIRRCRTIQKLVSWLGSTTLLHRGNGTRWLHGNLSFVLPIINRDSL